MYIFPIGKLSIIIIIIKLYIIFECTNGAYTEASALRGINVLTTQLTGFWKSFHHLYRSQLLQPCDYLHPRGHQDLCGYGLKDC